MLVVDKPAGLVVHPGAGHSTGTLVHGLLASLSRRSRASVRTSVPGIVHRLDKDTSGLLLVARTPEAYRSLTKQLKAREITRRYLALVWGHLDAPRGVIDAPIGRSAAYADADDGVDTRDEKRERPTTSSRSTHEPAPASLLECTLDTGRTHQIRVHLAAIGHPVVGDDRYGGRRATARQTGSRFFLHAASLGLRPSSDRRAHRGRLAASPRPRGRA